MILVLYFFFQMKIWKPVPLRVHLEAPTQKLLKQAMGIQPQLSLKSFRVHLPSVTTALNYVQKMRSRTTTRQERPYYEETPLLKNNRHRGYKSSVRPTNRPFCLEISSCSHRWYCKLCLGILFCN